MILQPQPPSTLSVCSVECVVTVECRTRSLIIRVPKCVETVEYRTRSLIPDPGSVWTFPISGAAASDWTKQISQEGLQGF